MNKQFTGLCYTTIFLFGFSSATDAALYSRLGGQAYYDDVLDITWLADANLAASNTFGLSNNTNLGSHAADNNPVVSSNVILSDGSMTWGASLYWLDAMNADGGSGYLGYGDWRIATMVDSGTVGCNMANVGTDCGFNVQTGNVATTVYSEMASLWSDTLGNISFFDTAGNAAQPGWGLSNTGPFSNIQSGDYWTDQEYIPVLGGAWAFSQYTGYQGDQDKTNTFYAWAVRSGDVSVVPVPATVWLFGSGLIGLIGVARKRR